MKNALALNNIPADDARMELILLVLVLALVAVAASVCGCDSRPVDERHTGVI